MLSIFFSSCILSSKNETNAGAERGASTCSVHSSGGHAHRDHVEDWWQANRGGHGSKVQLYFHIGVQFLYMCDSWSHFKERMPFECA